MLPAKQGQKNQVKENEQNKTYKTRMLRELKNGLIDVKTVRASTIEKYKIKLDEKTYLYVSEM